MTASQTGQYSSKSDSQSLSFSCLLPPLVLLTVGGSSPSLNGSPLASHPLTYLWPLNITDPHSKVAPHPQTPSLHLAHSWVPSLKHPHRKWLLNLINLQSRDESKTIKQILSSRVEVEVVVEDVSWSSSLVESLRVTVSAGRPGSHSLLHCTACLVSAGPQSSPSSS